MSTTPDIIAPNWKQTLYAKLVSMTPLQAVENELIDALALLKRINVSDMTEPHPHSSTRRNKVTHAEWQRRDSFARGLATAIAYMRQGDGLLSGANTADNIRSEFWNEEHPQ